jgi:hypothetical protein
MARPAFATVATVEHVTLAATGTDGGGWAEVSSPVVTANTEPGLWIEAGEPLERLEITPSAPTAAQLAAPRWHVLLVLAGPLLALAGLLALAQLAAPLVEGRI